MTYSVDGRQYIVVAVSGGDYTGEYLAFALPQNARHPSTRPSGIWAFRHSSARDPERWPRDGQKPGAYG